MRFTIDKDQKKFFQRYGWLELEGLLKVEERDELFKAVEKILLDYPGNTFERGRFLSRSVSLILQLIRRKGWGELASELVDTTLLRLAYDHVFHDPSKEQISQFHHLIQQPGNVCSFLLSLENKKSITGLFFNAKGFENLSFTPHQWYLLLVFTPYFLNEDFHPIVTKK